MPHSPANAGRCTSPVAQLLLDLGEAAGLKGKIEAMFAGQRINATEGRAVLHTALRAPRGADVQVGRLVWAMGCGPVCLPHCCGHAWPTGACRVAAKGRTCNTRHALRTDQLP